VGDSDVVKVHIHTDFPGEVLQFCASLGNLTEIAIDNMYLQNLDYEDTKSSTALTCLKTMWSVFPLLRRGILSLWGLWRLYRVRDWQKFPQSRCRLHRARRQTMNPSTEELVQAVNSVNAEAVIILPNNKNVIFSAEQAKELG